MFPLRGTLLVEEGIASIGRHRSIGSIRGVCRGPVNERREAAPFKATQKGPF